jgi:tetratricopeptide (TPR) repeat protein
MRHFQFRILTVHHRRELAVFRWHRLSRHWHRPKRPNRLQAPSAEAADPLDSLFSELKRERDTNQAKRISERIWARWRDSGSATTNLLLQWADKAMVDKKNSLALDLLDQVVVLMPDFAEGWNRRATLHYAMGNHSKSMADINRVLALEPRHFGAMAGMAAILDASGNDALALRAWEQMLEVYPANRQAQTKVGELADKLAGSKT